MKLKDLDILGWLLFLAVLLRFISFFPSVINHDESTYIVIASALLKGDLYFVDVIDTKPIGIFLIYALFQKLFGASIFMYRFMATVFLALTAFFLYKSRMAFDGNKPSAIASAIIYLLLNSIFTYYGVSPNTETYFNLFSTLALFLILKYPKSWSYILAGFSLGVGFIIKYVILFDAIAFGLFLLWEHKASTKKFLTALGNGKLMAIMAAIPILTALIYYWQIDQLEPFLFFTFECSSRYPVSVGFLQYFTFPIDFLLRFFPITFFYFYVLFSGKVDMRLKMLGVLWSLGTLVVVLMPGRWYGHYFIQFMLPFSFIAGSFFGMELKDLPKFIRPVLKVKTGYILLGILLITNFILQKKDYLDRPDSARQIAAYLQDKLAEDDGIYTGNSHQILYHLLDKKSPITYVHPSLFWEQKHIKALEIDVKKEMAKITGHPPKFIIIREDVKDDRFEKFLEENYVFLKNFGRELVYELKN